MKGGVPVRKTKRRNAKTRGKIKCYMAGFVVNLLPIGVITDGVCLTHYKNMSWVGPVFGMGMACLGL